MNQKEVRFLHNSQHNELFTLFAQGLKKESRISDDIGIAGYVFKTAKGVIIEDVYNDPHFNNKMEVITYFHYGLNKYKKFIEAIKVFEQALLLHQNPVTQMYIQRCQHFITNLQHTIGKVFLP